MANSQINVQFRNTNLSNNKHSIYLRISLDHTLSFRNYLENFSAKITPPNNIIQNTAETLRSSSVVLVYSGWVCARVWINSCHTKQVDRQLNNTMRLISGTIQSIPLHWLTVLCNILPLYLCRNEILLREHKKITGNLEVPIQEDIPGFEPNRLNSRKSPTPTAECLQNNNYNSIKQWTAYEI